MDEPGAESCRAKLERRPEQRVEVDELGGDADVVADLRPDVAPTGDGPAARPRPVPEDAVGRQEVRPSREEERGPQPVSELREVAGSVRTPVHERPGVVLVARRSDDVPRPVLDVPERLMHRQRAADVGIVLAQHDDVGGRLGQEPEQRPVMAERLVRVDHPPTDRLDDGAVVGHDLGVRLAVDADQQLVHGIAPRLEVAQPVGEDERIAGGREEGRSHRGSSVARPNGISLSTTRQPSRAQNSSPA